MGDRRPQYMNRDSIKQLDYVINLTRFALRENPLLYLSVTVSVVSSFIELLAISSLLPLLKAASGQTPPTGSIAVQILVQLGCDVSAHALLMVFLLLFTVRVATQIAGQSLSMLLSRRVLAQLCSSAFQHVVRRLDIRELNAKSIGFYINLAGEESYRASNLIMSLTQFVSTALLAILYFWAIVRFSPLTGGLILVLSIIAITALYQVARVSHRLGGGIMDLSRKANSIFLDAINNLKTVRAFSAEAYVADIQRSLIFRYAKTQFMLELVAMLTKMVPVLALLLLGIALALGSQTLDSANLAFVVTLIVYLMRFLPAVGQGVTLLMRIAADAKSGQDVTEMLARAAEPQSAPVAQDNLGEIRDVSLRDVGFTYGEASGKKVLHGVNLQFERGKTYALVGKSGIGKSTLVDLLLKFYLPTDGQLYLNDVPVADVAEFAVRKKIILVSQEAAIFDDTVVNNVRLGMEATLADVRAACKAAHIDDVIEAMPDGYNTRLQYQGKNLSGGQRQRLAIARALLRNPDVLILDESTSALDKHTQEQVVGNILREYAEKIVVFITHDPHIMERVDEVIDLGRLNQADSRQAKESR